jgi:hypothetical protein
VTDHPAARHRDPAGLVILVSSCRGGGHRAFRSKAASIPPRRGHRKVDKVVRVARGPAAWLRRGLLAVILIGAAIIPGRASSLGAQHCSGLRCTSAGSVLWTRALPGSWVAGAGVTGTVTGASPPYAAVGPDVAVVAAGTTVTAFSATTGSSLWQVSTDEFTEVPAGSVIAGVRAFAGVVAVGVEPAVTTGATGTGTTGSAPGRDEVILSAATGTLVRVYPAAVYGGAIAAGPASTVIVGAKAVTDYSNATGRVLWRRLTGAAGQTWRLSGGYVYLTETSSGNADGVLVTALRRISLRTGAQRIIRPEPGGFDGTLSAVTGGVALFSGADGVRAYSAVTGEPLWHVASAALELTDAASGSVYLDEGSTLAGVSVTTGHVRSSTAASVAGSLYSVQGGVALGLDQNSLGEVWGYSLTTRKIIWTSAGVPWPHYFIDLSGLGGSLSPGSDILLLASCGRVGAAAGPAAAPACLQPDLSAVRISG